MKITPEHLARGAFVYVRQSTADQLATNHESRRRQYGLAERARALGWTDVTVIDDDLGRSGSGISRPGFERLLAAICEDRVGAVFAIEASRLARNGRDWHTLIEFCGLVGTVIVDEDGVYEPRHPNDRLLLGIKGTMSELELSLLRARSMEALKQKARRGELFFTVAVGYVKAGRDKIEMDPDLRVREGISLVFARFAEMQSIRQVFLSLRADQIALPYVDPKSSGQRQLRWKLPIYSTVNNLLTNPVYAGAYVFGRTGSRTTIENGRKRILRGYRKDRSDWAVLLVDHHEGYLSWADFERNQRLIADNANGKGMMVRGAVRKGEALLAGLLRCGHCGRRLLVSYNGTKGDIGRYYCDATRSNPEVAACISFGALRVDQAVGVEIVRLLQPLGVEAAVRAITDCEHQSDEKQRQLELALEQARYEAVRARRQYDAVDPDNRLVAGELERRWNVALAAVDKLQKELEALIGQRPVALGAAERQRLLQMGSDLEAAWHHPAATAVTRKRIIRTVLREVVARVENDQIQLLLHWRSHSPHGEEEPKGSDALGRRARNDGSDPGMRAIDARQGHCRDAQPNRKANRPAQRMVAVAGTWLPQHARHYGLRRRRMGRAWRNHIDRSSQDARPEPHNRASLDPGWHHSCRAILQRRALGDQAPGYRGAASGLACQDGPQSSSIIRSRSAYPCLSMM
jgi:DNA invertase Pin-like site-specific DNA recombinase